MSDLELVAAFFGIVCVGLTIFRHIGSWPAGLIQVALYVVVFYQAQLYADMILHVVYVVLQIYGWYAWAKSERSVSAQGETCGGIQVRMLKSPAQVGLLVVVIATTFLFWMLLSSLSSTPQPAADSFIAATSLVAQFLLTQRYVENWVAWIVVDIVGIGLFYSKELYPTAVLYGLFLIMASIGLVAWLRRLRASVLAAQDFGNGVSPLEESLS